jgi:hypothetical protein
MTSDSILTREHLISAITVNGTEILNANLLGAYDPWALFLAIPKVHDVIKRFSYIRGTMIITIRVTPPGSCFGALVVSAIPEGGMDVAPNSVINVDYADDLVVDTLHTSFNDLFSVLNFEKASTVVMELPWEYYNHYFATDEIGGGWMWRLQMQSLVPIQSTISTTAAADIKIYASLKEGYELAVPNYQAKKPVTHVKGLTGDGGKKGAVSDIASQVAGLASSVAGHIPMLAPFAGPIATGASAVSAVASFFGFTRDSTFVPPDPTTLRLFSSTTLVDGVDTGDSLVMTTGATLSIDPAIGGGEREDPMCFESIRQRWGCVSYFELSTSSAAGNRLHSLPVSPFYGGVNLGRICFTPGGYYGLPFAKWRGGMEYIIYIPSSENMRGMLQICYNPGVASVLGPVAMADPTGSVHSVSLDLSGTQQHLIQVPYAGAEISKWSNCMCDGTLANRSPSNCNGSLDFYLASNWVAPRAGVVTTRVFILARPMSDMAYADPRIRVGGRSAGIKDLSDAICYQSSVDESVGVIETSMLGQALEQEFNWAAAGVTEIAPSARALVQKFSPILQVNSTVASPTPRWVQTLMPMVYLTVNTWLTAGAAGEIAHEKMSFSWYKFYTMLFVGVRGGTRAKVLIDQGSGLMVAPVDVFGVQSANSRGSVPLNFLKDQHTSYQVSAWDRAVEFGFPYNSERLYLNPRRFTVLSLSNAGPIDPQGQRSIGIHGFPNQKVPWTLMVAGGSDCSVTRFRRVPSLLASFLIPSV